MKEWQGRSKRRNMKRNMDRSSHRRCSVKKILLKRDSTQVFSCETYQIFKNTYFEGHLRTSASV